MLPAPVGLVKNKIKAGGRSKGIFKELIVGAEGGVRIFFSPEDAIENVYEMLDKTIVTQQAGSIEKQINRRYIEDGADIERKIYISTIVDRETGKFANA